MVPQQELDVDEHDGDSIGLPFVQLQTCPSRQRHGGDESAGLVRMLQATDDTLRRHGAPGVVIPHV
ncbi:hypothetical protein FOXG_22433 [Fusarium oxysporum f. sp. lycopersici 4287]|uniref:Uncharacterized protein n=1 Tax=Fusarium oxysporum f. sp. lycopersici (strain 4287 / CBS 123668 / FGSC 9935 / NRRL 34936) TaxID=426428 RepID=A0A0J9W742_FUSO4|nr:hypothetical protein FOXG_19274 [Fusarium oxysporum f. sp. lycopersici 4287]XP_018242774.1 hypothetical protein FOXG_19385 [Fusarium oxysporum f. sp. lycopersici 4287]XP_018244700.1 hypothetical protein FOXG_19748 [Fusarium oxysporum f. sp. lycopersici 4287]XP_018256999.1 uncharacterized protein FOXG_22433 [Fusarium oxysporum f. sp. lycopersici 4287]KNB04361.1 hypothetical protein FOXG_19274 [Fusarium oxysporum f. sp. lycopersici 4287]KNB04729.1 hypothetical protein FOXG_19385 [Fusarium oxy